MFFGESNRQYVKNRIFVEDGALRRQCRRAQRQAAQQVVIKPSNRQKVHQEIIRSALASLPGDGRRSATASTSALRI